MTNGDVIKMVLKELIRTDYFTDARSLEMANLVINDEEYLSAMLAITSLATTFDPKLLAIINKRAFTFQMFNSIMGENE